MRVRRMWFVSHATGALLKKLERLRGLPLNPDDDQSIKVNAWLSQFPSITVKSGPGDTWLTVRQRRIQHLSQGLELYLLHQRSTRQPYHKLRARHQRYRAIDYIVGVLTQPPTTPDTTASTTQPPPKFPCTRPPPVPHRPKRTQLRLQKHQVVLFLGDAKVNTGGCIKSPAGGPPLKDLKTRVAPHCELVMMKEWNTSQSDPRCVNDRFRQT